MLNARFKSSDEENVLLSRLASAEPSCIKTGHLMTRLKNNSLPNSFLTIWCNAQSSRLDEDLFHLSINVSITSLTVRCVCVCGGGICVLPNSFLTISCNAQLSRLDEDLFHLSINVPITSLTVVFGYICGNNERG